MSTKRRFNKHNLILHEDVNWQCICADDEIAVFARFQTIHEKDGSRNDVDYENLFTVSNYTGEDGFEYELIDG